MPKTSCMTILVRSGHNAQVSWIPRRLSLAPRIAFADRGAHLVNCRAEPEADRRSLGSLAGQHRNSLRGRVETESRQVPTSPFASAARTRLKGPASRGSCRLIVLVTTSFPRSSHRLAYWITGQIAEHMHATTLLAEPDANSILLVPASDNPTEGLSNRD